MTRRPIAVVLVALTVAAACTPASPDGAPAPAALTVYAAASLKGAMEEIVPVYARAVPGVTLTVPGLDRSFSTTEPSGEALLAPYRARIPIPVEDAGRA